MYLPENSCGIMSRTKHLMLTEKAKSRVTTSPVAELTLKAVDGVQPIWYIIRRYNTTVRNAPPKKPAKIIRFDKKRRNACTKYARSQMHKESADFKSKFLIFKHLIQILHVAIGFSFSIPSLEKTLLLFPLSFNYG